MSIDELVGKTVIEISGAKPNSKEIKFICSDKTQYKMYHEQDCCEIVSVCDVCGDINDIIGVQIVKATEDTNSKVEKKRYDTRSTWTFYNISTVKGHVTIRWYGESNGYYSEEVSFKKIKKHCKV